MSQEKNVAPLPYGRQIIDDEDINAVVEVLKSDWLTTGPWVKRFETTFAQTVGAEYAVAVSSGTAALHAIMAAIGIESGDEVIVPPITFAATANCVIYQGGTPVFADVDADTLLIDPDAVESAITSKTKAVVAVDYAGQPCDYKRLREICDRHDLVLVADACHALGAFWNDRPVGSLADLTAFSLHPVKLITAGEGGVVSTDNPEWDQRLRRFRNHGINFDHHQRQERASWAYDIPELGFNYRLTDIQCALAESQLKKLPAWIKRRNELAQMYQAALAQLPGVTPLRINDGLQHAYHLFVVLFEAEDGRVRESVFHALRGQGIGVNVHYVPVYRLSFYQRRFALAPGLCPNAEFAYTRMLTLPLHPGMDEGDVNRVVSALKCAVET